MYTPNKATNDSSLVNSETVINVEETVSISGPSTSNISEDTVQIPVM